MFKNKIFIKLLTFFVLLYLPLFAEDTQQMTIRLNGHEYQVDDIFSKKVKEMYNEQKEKIKQDVRDEIIRTQPDASLNLTDITLPSDIAVNYFFDSNSNQDTLIAFLNDIHVKFNFGACSFNSRFDLKIKYLLSNEIDSSMYKVKFDFNSTKVSDFHMDSEPRRWYQFWNWIVCEGYEWLADNFGNVEEKIEKQVSKALIDTTFKVLDFADLADGNPVPQSEVEALENSFPMSGSLKADLNKGLVIEVNFMEGNNGQYAGIVPDAVPQDHKLDIGGIAFLYPNLQQGYEWQSWSTEQRIDAAFDKMAEHGISGCRVEARWDKIQRSSEVVLGKDPSQVTDTDINNLMNNGAPEWDILNYILNKADEKGIIVFMAVGVGHEDRTPGTPSAPSANMAPDNSSNFDSESGKYVAVTANDYLYNLKLYSRAVIRKFANRVGVWQIENELNAARFAESFHWWRKGNLWEDDQPGGFQDQVWNTLVNAVHDEDPRSKIMHDFHMFDITDRLERWAADLDIIGVNFYPNQLFAYPVLGFSVGEFVWATRRVLKGLGMADKPVWVTETGYPAKTDSTAPDPYSVDKDVLFFTEERQQQYITDALNSSVENGAHAFYYYALTAQENDGGDDTPSLNKNMRYSGLIRKATNEEKQALAPFGTQYVNSYPGMGKTRLINRYGSENIGGQVSLKGERDFMASGDTTWLVKDIKHTARTELEKTVHNGTKIKHHDWDGDYSNWEMDNSEFTIAQSFETHNAYFQPTNTGVITIKTNLISAGGSDKGKIEFKDPWYVENGTQPNVFKKYDSPFTPGGGDDSYYDGIFLNQYLDKTHYSVQAQAKDTIGFHNEAITWYFQNWSGTDVSIENANSTTTGVKFNTANSEIHANYKGHLASSVARATGYNNGRRMAKDGTGKLHLVYEDNGEIWYAYSCDNGQTWSKEERISAKKYTDSHGIEHSYIHPSIAAENDGSVYVAYECQLKKGSTVDTYILFRKKDNNWSNILTVSKGYYNSYGWWSDYQDHDDTYPTVTAGPSGIFVAYQSVTDDYHHYKSIKLRQYLSGEWSVESKLSSANGKPVIGNLSGTYKIALIWPHNGRIKYRAAYTYYNDEKDAWDWHWASEYDLSNFCPGLFDEHSQPSVTIDANNHGYMAWLAVDQEMDEQNVLYQKFNFGASPSSASSVYSLDFNEDYLIESPSVSYDASNGRVTVYYQYHNNIYRKYLSGSSWYYHYYGDGNFPNICAHSSVGAVWTKYTSAPYLLQSENLQNHLNKTSLAEVEAFKRFYFKSDSGYLAFDLKDVTLDDQTLTIHDDLHSDTVKVDAPVRFDYRIDLKSKAQAGTFLNFYFVSGDQKYLLDQFELSGDESESEIERSVTFDPGRAMQGYVHIVFAQEEPFTVNVVPDNATGLAKASSGAGWQAFVPEHFQLKQNFPNPFNPSTQIVFDLPQEAQITLQVFDINGHKVATLAKGLKAAGRYHVVFDARNLASGVYIYRLSTDKGFVQSKKMMLIR